MTKNTDTKARRTRKLKSVEDALKDIKVTVIGPTEIEAQMATTLGAPALSESEEAVVEALAASEAVHDEPASDPVLEPPASEPQSFDAIIEALDPAEVERTVTMIATTFDDRAAFERAVGPGNENIHKTLKKARERMTVSKAAAKVMMATQTDPAILNRSIHEGARYNVYAIGKLADLIDGLSGKSVANAINRAITRSLFQCKNGGVTFTGELAKAAASDKIRIDPAVRKFLVSHTVSPSTAPTQASSTMQALETLGIVKVEGSRRHPTYIVTDTPAARKLEELVLKAA